MAITGSALVGVATDTALDGVSLDALANGASTTTAAAVDAASGSGFGDALVGAGNELFGDAATMAGDAIVDGVTSIGGAVVDAAVGVATDAAIGSGTLWGVWDGLHRILPTWLLSGGAVAIAGEVGFAIFAFYVASSSFSGTDEGQETVGGPPIQPVDVSMAKDSNVQEEIGKVFSNSAVMEGEIDISDVLMDVQLALKTAEDSLSASSNSDAEARIKNDQKVLLFEQRKRDELFHRKLLEARIRYDQSARANDNRERNLKREAPLHFVKKM
jgi:hypothetical protein